MKNATYIVVVNLNCAELVEFLYMNIAGAAAQNTMRAMQENIHEMELQINREL